MLQVRIIQGVELRPWTIHALSSLFLYFSMHGLAYTVIDFLDTTYTVQPWEHLGASGLLMT